MYPYKKQRISISCGERKIGELEAKLQRKKDEQDKKVYELNGHPDSPFYGLKYPSQTKIMNYIGDKYNVCDDLLEKIQKILVKKDMEKCRREYVYSCICEYIDMDYRNLPWNTLMSRRRDWRDYMKGKKISDNYDYRILDERYWFGGFVSESVGYPFMDPTTYKHKITIKNKKEIYSADVKLTKANLIKILNTCDIKYKSSMSKKELYNLVVSKTYRKKYLCELGRKNTLYLNFT